MPIPDSVLNLAGFTLAQAVRSISGLPVDDALCAFAIVEEGEKRTVTEFNDPKHAAAPAGRRDILAAATQAGHAWAYARESSLEEGREDVDAISIEFRAAGMELPVTLFQRFQTAGGRGGVRLIGDPEIVIGRMVKDADAAEDLVRIIKRGMMQHRNTGDAQRAV